MPDAVVLLSGGIDSTTTAALAAEQGFSLYALSFAYGQRHHIELEAARRVAKSFGVRQHITQNIDLTTYGGSALTDQIDVPLDRDPTAPADIPVTYVPARNTIFLAHALAYAETLASFDIFIGANAVDYSGYPDCRPAFIEKFQELANLATAAGVDGRGSFTIHAPLIHMSKVEIIRTGITLGIDYSITHSCYAPTPDGAACGRCDSCTLRANGFKDAGVPDPTRYA
jgi:7-cyano-7-deazaguanine synthase